MPEYLSPGVYVEEVSFRSKSIEGVSTSTCAFVGSTRKGPMTETPEVVTSFGEFERIYGGLENLSFTSGTDDSPNVTNYMAHAVRAFFDNGGKRLYIGRTFTPRTDGGGEVVTTGKAAATIVDNAGNTARFLARDPGSGGNGTVRVFAKKTRITPRKDILTKAPIGSLLCVGGTDISPAQPARLVGGKPPFSMVNGDELGLTLSSGLQNIQFNGTSAEATAPATISEPVTIADGDTLVVSINGVVQRIALTAGETTFAGLLNMLNSSLRHGYARVNDTRHLVIGTDRHGTGAQVVVSKLPVLGFENEVSETGTGTVQDLEAVTMEEINTLLTAVGNNVRASLPPSTGLMNLTTTATGDNASLQVRDNNARLALGLPTEADAGESGAALLYYEKRGQKWVGGADGSTLLDPTSITSAEIITINIEAEDADGKTFFYENLGLGPRHPRYIGHVLSQTPTNRTDQLQNPYYFAVTGALDVFQIREGLFGSALENSFPLENGNDGNEPTAASTVEGASSFSDALKLLESIEDISIIAAPGHSFLQDATYKAAQDALISHAERMKYRIAVLDTPPNKTIAGAREARGRIDSTYAALYYPWIMVANPLARPGNESIPREIALPPSGFITGIYARTDINRGVWKPPANEVIRGALRFEREINHGQQEVLNPEGINCLRFFFGRGNRVWGARTASSDPEWKYVNVRRYFIYLKRSIDRSTQWAVFEPNGERLWSNITDTVTAFLYNEWRSDALLGATPEEAFFVRCDRSTMTQNDLDNGRLICEVGVAALKPAEFVIFRIGQKTAEAKS